MSESTREAFAALPHSAPSAVLGYVTPWNRDGLSRAVAMAGRMTHVSPVWYDVGKPSFAFDGAASGEDDRDGGERRVFVPVGGDHHANVTWLDELKAAHMRVVPRFQLDRWATADITNLLTPGSASGAKVVKAFIKAVTGIMAKRKAHFDGVVLEWGHLPLSTPGIRPGVVSLFVELRLALVGVLGRDPVLILVIPADVKAVGWKELQWLFDDALLDYVSVMSYDYSLRTGQPGPNAPIEWFNATLMHLTGATRTRTRSAAPPPARGTAAFVRSRVLMGVNFYGYFYRNNGQPPDAILGRDVVKTFRRELANEKRRADVEKRKPRNTPTLRWDPLTAEHSYDIPSSDGVGGEVYYPSRASLAFRLRAVMAVGAGVAIWDLGQGLPYFVGVFPPLTPPS